MNKSEILKNFKSNNITIDDIKQRLHDDKREKLQVCFPFDDSLIGNPNEILTKILFINFKESVQLKNKDIKSLKIHIEEVMSNNVFEIIRCGELNEDYFNIVDKIASGHGIRNKKKDGTLTEECCFLSFATKFCASHNQIAPFLDTLVPILLEYFGYKYKCKSKSSKYRDYVECLKQFQKENDLTEYSLREIELTMWEVVKDNQ